MTIDELLTHLCSSDSIREWWPCPAGHDPDDSLLMCAAAISLSGMLDDCRSEDDLQEAAGHAVVLLNAGIISMEAWGDESQRMDERLQEWGDEFAARRRAAAESN